MNCVGSTAGPDFTNTSKNTYLYNVCVLQGVKFENHAYETRVRHCYMDF